MSTSTKEDVEELKQDISQIRKSLSETYKVMIEASTGVKILTERFDRHLPEQKTEVRNIYSKLDTITENQNKNKIEVLKEIQLVNLDSKVKTTSLTERVGLLYAILMSTFGLVNHFLKK